MEEEILPSLLTSFSSTRSLCAITTSVDAAYLGVTVAFNGGNIKEK